MRVLFARDLFGPCNTCSYWESPEGSCETLAEEDAHRKSEWLDATARQFAPCAKLLCAEGNPVAFCQYAPPHFTPGVCKYTELAPRLDPDAVLITCLYVTEGHRGKGFGRALLREVIEDLRRRNCGAIETIGRNDSTNNCSGPTQLYLSEGFSVVATETYEDGASFSLLRLDLEAKEKPLMDANRRE